MSKFTILIPHFRTGKMTAYTIAQLLKCKGKHEIDIFVIDNNPDDGSTIYLKPFINDIKYQRYPKDKTQSHGIAFDFVMPYVTTEYFITIESDSFPTDENWLDYYEHLIENNFDCAGSLMKLSGGTYIHPAGALYKKSIWQQAKQYCNEVEYAYFPNMSMKEGFACHVMAHKSVVEDLMKNLYDYIEPADGYKKLSRTEMVTKMVYYSPVVAPFHNGMGKNEESIKTYGNRTMDSEYKNVLHDNKKKIINRIGFEPGQWFSYFMKATLKKIFEIPTQINWLPGRENQQQQSTIMENGFTHLWGISAYHDYGETSGDMQDIAVVKKALPEELYESLPEHQKIKI